MRKMWLLPIIGSIGNMFSSASIWIIPLAIVSSIIASILKMGPKGSDEVLQYLLLISPVYLFYKGASGRGIDRIIKDFGSRPMDHTETQKYMPLISEVLAKHNEVHGGNWQYGKDLDVSILDDDDINACAVGKKYVIFNSGLLKLDNDDVFKAILAHEMGHLYHKDTLISSTNYYVQLPTQYVLNMFRSIRISSGFDTGTAITLCMKLYFLPALLIGKIVNFICNTVQKMLSKQQEFAADTYAVKLGYSFGLSIFLECSKGTHMKPNRLMQLFESHPEPELRIKNIEDVLEELE